MRKINRLIVHCSATSAEADIDADTINKWHKSRGWSGIGYHWVIKRDGTLENGRDAEEVGAHAYGFNKDSLGVCLVGGVNKQGEPDANYTMAQYYTLNSLYVLLKAEHDLYVCGHRDLPGVTKACPCFDVKSFLSALPKKLEASHV